MTNQELLNRGIEMYQAALKSRWDAINGVHCAVDATRYFLSMEDLGEYKLIIENESFSLVLDDESEYHLIDKQDETVMYMAEDLI